jgi:hypothetical protein
MNRVLGLLSGALLFCACTSGVVIGSDKLEQCSRTVDPFTGVSVASGLTATVTVGPASSVVVSGDDNIVPLVQTTVEGGVLKIATEEFTTLVKRQPLLVTVTLPTLDAVSASGGSTLGATGAAADAFTASASGGSQVTVAGTAASLVADSSGGSWLHLQDLVAQGAQLSASGGSHLEVGVASGADGFTASATGGSDITAEGTAATVMGDASGASWLHLEDLVAQSARLSASGGSHIEADATATAEADASGGSQIVVAGGGTITKSVSGGSTVSAQ